MKKAFTFLYFFVCAMMLFSVTALAYIDPSAMTYIIQIIAGVAIAAGAAVGFYFRRIKRAFSKLKKNDDAQDSWDYDQDDDDDSGYDDYEIDAEDTYESEAPPSPTGVQPQQPAPVAYASDELKTETSKYDETGFADLAAENRELRRLLAEEREKVEILKKALQICTTPRA